jgi:hypothetical protein
MAISEYTDWLRSSLLRYEELAKCLVEHRGEKGRIVEAVIKTALRSILPERFSIGTGFAITRSGETSSQLDLVIYDAMFNAPVILESGIGLFPIECIYGFMEVKTSLSHAALDAATEAIATVRRFRHEKWYVGYERTEIEPGKPVSEPKPVAMNLAPRSFLIAIKSEIGSIDAVEKHLREATLTFKARTPPAESFVHGLAVLEKDWFLSQRPRFDEPPEFIRKEDASLARFCACVLDAIQSIEMRPAAMSDYLGVPQK